MNWTVVLTPQARQDLDAIYSYVAVQLQAKETARTLVEKLKRDLHTLEFMPKRYRLYDEEPWHSRGLRFFTSNRYLIFYRVVDEEGRVVVIRIMHGSRDVAKQLDIPAPEDR